MENNNIWNTGTLPVTIAVNGYTVTLERKERETSETRTKGLQTLYFGTIADSDGNISPVEGKPINWIKKRVGDNSARQYTRVSDGVRVTTGNFSDDKRASMVASYTTRIRVKCGELLALCETIKSESGAQSLADSLADSLRVFEAIAPALYDSKLQEEQRAYIAQESAKADKAKAKAARATISDADILAFLAWKAQQSAQE